MRKMVLVLVAVLLLVGSYQTIAANGNISYHQRTLCSFQELTTTDAGSYLSVDIDGADDSFVMQNHYMIPSKIETYTFPYGTKIESISVTPTVTHTLSLEKPIEIASPAKLLDGSSDNFISSNVQEPLTVSSWYTYDIGAGIINNQQSTIVKIELFPVQYSPEDNSIVWSDDLSIDIKYRNSEKSYGSSSLESYELIILAPSEFTNELEPLATHKMNRDITTKIVSLSDIYYGIYFPTNGRDEQEQIKYFIKDAIEQWGTKSVLAVGGYDEFPSRLTHVYVNYGSGDDEVFVSDLYYADIYDENGFCSWDSNNNDVFGEFDWGSSHLTDEVDIYPDVAYGRLACISEDEVTAVVNKIIQYETAESYKTDWFGTVLYCGGDTFPGDYNEVDEGEYLCEYVSGFMTGFSSNKKFVTEGTLRTTIDVSDGLDAGSGFFVLAGHANPQSWSTHPHENPNIWIPTSGFRNSHAAALGNGEKLPILLTESCSPFKFSASDNCLGWSFVSNPSGGAIAGFGATGLSWGSDGTSVVTSLTGKILVDTLKSYKQDGAITPGEMWTMGINKYYRPSMDGGSHKSVEEWQFLGDPTLAIAGDSQPPNKPNTPEGPSSGKAKETYVYSTSTIDPEGDDVYYLFDWGDGTESGWIGPYDSGRTCEVSYTWSSKGTYEIRVKAQDFHGVVSDWSDPLEVSMPRAKTYQILFFERLLQHFPQLQSFFPFL